MKTVWVRMTGVRTPPPLGTEIKAYLEQDIDGRPIRFCGKATCYGDRAVVRISEHSKAGATAIALLEDDCLDAVYWGSTPTLRLRP